MIYSAPYEKESAERNFHVIASNPPYIRTGIIPTLQREIAEHEPMIALDGGEDGLDFYRRIVVEASDFLKPEGLLFLEIGHDQGEAVCALARETERFEDITIIRDLAGHDRVVKCKLKAPEKKSRRGKKAK